MKDTCSGAGPDRGGVGEGHRLSEILGRLAAQEGAEQITVHDLIEALEGRTRIVLLVLFALPNCLPAGIPGTSTVTGLPMMILALQMMLGREPWLPPFVTRRAVTRSGLRRVVAAALPWILRVESLLRPRLGARIVAASERPLSILILGLACIVMLPVPFGNALPSIAIILIAMGLMERDGLWVLAGLAMATAAVAVVSAILGAIVLAIVALVAG